MTMTTLSAHRSALRRLSSLLLLCAAVAASPVARSDPPPGVPHGPPSGVPRGSDEGGPRVQWINHFDLLPGGPEVTTTFNSTSSGVGGGLTGLVIHSSTVGDAFADGGNKVVQMALELPKNTIVTGVRLCYELSSPESFVSQIRLAQVQDPPAAAAVLLDDGTDLTDPGPVCVDSATTFVRANDGAILLSLRTDFGNVADSIVVRAVGLHVK